MKKFVKELKWLGLSTLIVIGTIWLVIGIANFCQWRVDVNMASVEAGDVQAVEYTRWGK